MAGSVNTEKEQVLRSVLRLWEDLCGGLAAHQLGRGFDETVTRAVGGHLVNSAGQLCSPTELRRKLVEWLRPQAAGAVDPLVKADFDVFLVSWGLAVSPERVKRWEEAGSPRRIEPGPQIARASGWETDWPGQPGSVTFSYLAGAELYPDRAAGKLVDGAVGRLLDTAIPWGEPRESRLGHDMRKWLRDAVAPVGLFESATSDNPPPATYEITRLAVTKAVGAALSKYVEVTLDATSKADVAVRSLAAVVLPHWREPAELVELREICAEYVIPGGHGQGGQDGELDVEFADFRPMFRTFASKARDYRGLTGEASRDLSNTDPVAQRRLAVLLDLAIAAVRDNSPDAPRRVQEEIADLVDYAVDAVNRQHRTNETVALLRALRASRPSITGQPQRPDHTLTFLQGLLADLSTKNQHGRAIASRSDSPAGWRDVNRLLARVDGYVKGGHQAPELILKRLATDMPAAVAALTSGGADAGELGADPTDARWRLLKGAGDALAKRPDTYESVIVAGSFAELSWVVANEQLPAEMRKLGDHVQQNLRTVTDGRLKDDLSGGLARIMRALPLADSKHANFDVAQRAANESVAYGTRALWEAAHSPNRSVHRIVAALTGLQLSLLQAGGVFVRSAETEMIVPARLPSELQRRRHGEYVRDLATTSYTYINLAVFRLHDINGVVRAGLMQPKELDYPIPAAAATAAMGMRTLLLWATMQMTYPDQIATDVHKLVPSIPTQFCQMLELPHLNHLNFADMTRIAIHYAFLSGDLTHPASNAKCVHPETPAHLKPGSARLDLEACGRHLIDSGMDTGILDVLELTAVRNTLNETSGGAFGEWSKRYNNPKRRTPTRFRRGNIAHVPTRLWDSTPGP